MKFYLDEDTSWKVAEIGRRRGLDVLSSHECGRNGLGDEQQLRLAATDGRCFVTRNRAHLVVLTVRFFESNWPHAGVLIIPASLPGDDFAAIAEALVRYDEEHPEGLQPHTIDFL